MINTVRRESKKLPISLFSNSSILIVNNDTNGVVTITVSPSNAIISIYNTCLITKPNNVKSKPVITPYLSIVDGTLYMIPSPQLE